jgi:hypothetical protein
LGFVTSEQNPLAFFFNQTVGNMAIAAFTAVHTVPIRGELPSPALQGGHPLVSNLATLEARAPATTAAPRDSRALRRSAGNPPRPLPSRPGSCLRRTASQKRSAAAGPPPGPCPYGAAPAEAATPVRGTGPAPFSKDSAQWHSTRRSPAPA